MSDVDIAILDACGFQPEKYEELIKKLQTKIKQLEDQLEFLEGVSANSTLLTNENQRLKTTIKLYENHVQSYFGKSCLERLKQKSLEVTK